MNQRSWEAQPERGQGGAARGNGDGPTQCAMLWADCDGDGGCLVHCSDDDSFHEILPCRFRCQPKPCANHEVCGGRLPGWVMDRYGGLCRRCILIGRLEMRDSGHEPGLDACPVCMDDSPGARRVKFPAEVGALPIWKNAPSTGQCSVG